MFVLEKYDFYRFHCSNGYTDVLRNWGETHEVKHTRNNPLIGEGGKKWWFEYEGPSDMFTPQYALDNESSSLIRMYQEIMKEALDSGHKNVRKSNRSGNIIFNVRFPLYRTDGSWWGQENQCLSTDEKLATEQMKYAELIE